VSKYSLQNEIPSATILNEVNTTLETRALARLAGHKLILDAIQNFRNKYPDWKLCITELLSKLGIQYQGKKKSNKNKMVVKPKIIKKNNKRTTDIKEFENIRSNSEDNTKNVENEINSKGSDIILKDIQTKTKPVHKTSFTDISSEDQNDELKSRIPSKTITKEKNTSLSKCDKSVNPSKVEINVLETQLLKNKSKCSTNKFVDNIDLGKSLKRKAEHDISSIVDSKKKRNIVDEIKPVCETVDSFFMTADDQDYMSVYKPPPLLAPTIERNIECSKLDYQKPKKDIFIKGKKVTLGKQNNSMGNRKEKRRQQFQEPVDMVLHPSWEAKRKQKSLAKFEGKKITFDDQD